jgi:type IV pilus assembly protein PilA
LRTREGFVNRRERGFSLLELLIVVAIILIITTVAIPNLIHTRMTANEASALKSLQVFNTACVSYLSTYGSFPHNQSDLGPPANGTISKTGADILGSDLAPSGGAVVSKSGYVFRYTAGPASASGNINSYTITADPEQFKESGVRRFYTDEKGAVTYTTDNTAPTAASTLVK